jgi:hypothetical protein
MNTPPLPAPGDPSGRSRRVQKSASPVDNTDDLQQKSPVRAPVHGIIFEKAQGCA